MKGADLASLLQLSVAVNLSFGALVSFIDPIREETNVSSDAIERYIADATKDQSAKPDSFISLLGSLCQNHFQYDDALGAMKSRLRYFNGLAMRIVFAILAAGSLAGLVWVSIIGDGPIPAWCIWIPVLTNSVPILAAFWLCYELSTYYRDIRPLIEKCHDTIRQLQTGP